MRIEAQKKKIEAQNETKLPKMRIESQKWQLNVYN